MAPTTNALIFIVYSDDEIDKKLVVDYLPKPLTYYLAINIWPKFQFDCHFAIRH